MNPANKSNAAVKGRRLLRLLSACGFLILALMPYAVAQDKSTGTPSAPVVVDGKDLFVVHERIFSFSPEDRAKAVSERILRLSQQPPSEVLPIQVADYENTTEITARDFVIMTVTDADAASLGLSRQQAASQYAQIIESTIRSLRARYSARTLLLGSLYSVAITILFIVTLRLISLLYRRSKEYVETHGRERIPEFRIQRVQLLSSAQITGTILTVLSGTRAVGVLILTYVYISIVFSFFPWTKGYARVLLQYVTDPLRSIASALIAHVPDFIFVIVIILVAGYLIKLVKFGFNEVKKGNIQVDGFYPDWADPTYKIVRFVIIALSAAVILPYLPGYRSPAFQGVSIFVGVLVSLSSTAAISNAVAGLALTYTRGFQVGDRVKIGETVGDVLDKTLLVTRVRTIKNVDISIPNSLVLANHMINFSSSAKRDGLILHTSITIGYDAPWRQVHDLLIHAALATGNILPEPSPFVLQTSLDDSYVSYEINAYTNKPSLMARTYSDLHENIQDKFNEAGVEIMSPHYSSIRDGNDVTVPEEYRPPDYSPKAFRVQSPRQPQNQDRS
ncbi:MAG TPA: mechanosensitive ion channel family protein [Terriglobia bacterium]|jgi:small-conductance mechanosensitive channel